MANVGINGLILREPFAGVSYSIYKMMCALAENTNDRKFSFLIPRALEREFPKNNFTKTYRSLLVSGKSPSLRILYEQLLLPLTFNRLDADYAHFPAWVSPRLFYLPYVVTIHDLIPFQYPVFCKSSTVKHFRSMVPRTILKANRIVVPTEHVKKQVISEIKGVDVDCISVVPFAPAHPPSGVRKERARKILKEKYSIQNEYFLFVGNIEPKKNLPLLLKAFFSAKMRKGFPHKLVIVGRKAWKYNVFDETIRAHGMDEMVQLVGYVPEEDIPFFYAGCSAFCFPSITEGFGIPLIEALQEGCHCLVSDIEPFRELAGNSATFLPITGLQEWRAAIEDAAQTNRATLEKREIRKRQVAKFTWENTAKKMSEVYQSLEDELGFS